MSTIYLVHQGSIVSKKQGRFQFTGAEQAPQAIPVREISKILLYGNIHLTTPVIATCLQQQIPVVFLSQSGQYKGHLWSADGGEITSEFAQFDRRQDEDFSRETARSIVRGKLQNSKRLLLRLNRKRRIDPVAEAIGGINADLRALEMVHTVEQLRGYEGSSAARYFPALGRLIQAEGFELVRRTKRPPTEIGRAHV